VDALLHHADLFDEGAAPGLEDVPQVAVGIDDLIHGIFRSAAAAAVSSTVGCDPSRKGRALARRVFSRTLAGLDRS
jgi:hypothetical protein